MSLHTRPLELTSHVQARFIESRNTCISKKAQADLGPHHRGPQVSQGQPLDPCIIHQSFPPCTAPNPQLHKISTAFGELTIVPTDPHHPVPLHAHVLSARVPLASHRAPRQSLPLPVAWVALSSQKQVRANLFSSLRGSAAAVHRHGATHSWNPLHLPVFCA